LPKDLRQATLTPQSALILKELWASKAYGGMMITVKNRTAMMQQKLIPLTRVLPMALVIKR
jgi:hypothetical protein